MIKDRVEDNEALLKKAAEGDRAARDRVIVNNMGLVYSVVKRFIGRGYERDDLIQIGSIGLIRAVERFDAGFGVKFSTYAVPMIIGEIKRFIRDDGIIKVSRSLKETATTAAGVAAEIENETGREATLAEIALRMDISAAELAVAIDSRRPPRSIYSPVDLGDGEGKTIGDKIECERDEIGHMLKKLLIEELTAELDDRERTIVNMRYFRHKTQTETAQKLGISQVQVSRLEKKILLRLRRKAEE